MNTTALAANIFSTIGVLLLAYSTFSDKKNNALLCHAGDSGLNALGNLLVGSYSAVVTHLISFIRNLLNAKGKMNKILLGIITASIVILGLIFNSKGWVGLLPIIASVEYTIWSSKSKDAQGLRLALIINMALWLVHDLMVGLYFVAATDTIIMILSLVNYIRFETKKAAYKKAA